VCQRESSRTRAKAALLDLTPGLWMCVCLNWSVEGGGGGGGGGEEGEGTEGGEEGGGKELYSPCIQ
jgi:hypothetical protein